MLNFSNFLDLGSRAFLLCSLVLFGTRALAAPMGPTIIQGEVSIQLRKKYRFGRLFNPQQQNGEINKRNGLPCSW